MAFLHSIFLTGGTRDVETLPWRIAANIESLKSNHPGVEHRLLGDVSLRAFIAANFDQEVLHAYERLTPLSYKADLGRFCLLLKNGGVYADLSVHLFKPVADFHALEKLHVFRDAFNQGPWIVSTSLIASPAGNPLFQHCIDEIVSNVRTGWYGANPLCPTGPDLLGLAIARHVALEDITLGETVRISHAGNSYGYVDRAGWVVAVNAKAGAGLTHLGAEKLDDYNSHYASRTIYGELGSGGARWSGDDYRKNGWLKQGPSGFGPGDCIFGPYADLEAGDYEATLYLDPQSSGVEVSHDVVSHGGQVVISRPQAHRLGPSAGPHEVRIPFSIDRPHPGVEFRITFAGPARVEVLGSSLVRRSGA